MRIGGFDLQFTHGCEDTDFFAMIAKLGPIVYVPQVVCNIRKGHESLTKDRSAMHASRCIYFKKHLILIDKKQSELKENLRRRLRGSIEWVTLQLLEKKPIGVLGYLREYRSVLGTRHFLLFLIAVALKFPIRFLFLYLNRLNLIKDHL